MQRLDYPPIMFGRKPQLRSRGPRASKIAHLRSKDGGLVVDSSLDHRYEFSRSFWNLGSDPLPDARANDGTCGSDGCNRQASVAAEHHKLRLYSKMYSN